MEFGGKVMIALLLGLVAIFGGFYLLNRVTKGAVHRASVVQQQPAPTYYN